MVELKRSGGMCLAVVGLILILASPRLGAVCTEYCQYPPIGQCVNGVCEVDYYLHSVEFLPPNCNWCEVWECDFYSECLFGGGCHCHCYYDLWREWCSGSEV